MSKKALAVIEADNRIVALTNAIPAGVSVSRAVIVEEITKLEDEADKALAVVERMEVLNADQAGNAAEVIRAITTALKNGDAARKVHTDALNKLIKKLGGFYAPALKKLEQAKDIGLGKVNVWRRAEAARLSAEAEARRKQREEEAAAHAAAQAALGDADGAQQILEEAAAVEDEPVKVQATGVYGTTLGTRTVSVGTVTDMRKFLRALSESTAPQMVAVLNTVTIGKAALNALAKAVNEGEALSPAGFEASTSDSSTFR